MAISPHIYLEPKSHTYYDQDGNKYKSVSAIIKPFKQPFDPEGKIIARVAKREGLTVDQVRAKWDKKRDDSCAHGTKIHEQVEAFFKGETQGLQDIAPYLPTLKQYKAQPYRFMSEVILSYKDKPIAGTADMIVDKGECLSILDWKTNEKIEKEPTYGFMLSPFNHLPDSNFWHYSLQLSIYAVMSEQEIDRLSLIHLKKTGEVVPIACPFLMDEAIAMLAMG